MSMNEKKRNIMPVLKKDWENIGSSYNSTSTKHKNGDAKETNVPKYGHNTYDHVALQTEQNAMIRIGFNKEVSNVVDEKTNDISHGYHLKKNMKKHTNKKKRKKAKSLHSKKSYGVEINDLSNKVRSITDENMKSQKYKKERKKQKRARRQSSSIGNCSYFSDHNEGADFEQGSKNEKAFDSSKCLTVSGVNDKDERAKIPRGDETNNCSAQLKSSLIKTPKKNSRTFLSVTRGLNLVDSSTKRELSSPLLLTMYSEPSIDKKNDFDDYKTDKLHKKETKAIDFYQAFQEISKIRTEQGFSNESNDDDHLTTDDPFAGHSIHQREQKLNFIINNDPFNVDAWLELASLSQNYYDHSASFLSISSSILDSKFEDKWTTEKMHKTLENKKYLQQRLNILVTAKKYNPGNADILCEYLTCLIQLEEDTNIIETEYNAAFSNIHKIGLKGIQCSGNVEENRDIQNHKSQRGRDISYNARSLLRLHQIHIKYLCQNMSRFNANIVRKAYHTALKSLSLTFSDSNSHDHGINQNTYSDKFKNHTFGNISGLESSILLLDYLRFESSMGYEEKAIGTIQFVLELNLSTHHLKNNVINEKNDPYEKWGKRCMKSFRDFWDSNTPRIGDSFPVFGWIAWEYQNTQTIRCNLQDKKIDSNFSVHKRKPRLKASDFFDNLQSGRKISSPNSENTTETSETYVSVFKPEIFFASNKFLDAYKIQTKYPQQNTSFTKNIILDDHDQAHDHDLLSQCLALSRECVAIESRTISEPDDEKIHDISNNHHLKKMEFNDLLNNDNPSTETSKTSPSSATDAVISKLVQQGLGDVVPSRLGEAQRNDNPDLIRVYSFVHKRIIEISRDEVRIDTTKEALRRTLSNLKEKNKYGKEIERIRKETKKSSPSNNVSKSEFKVSSINIDDPFIVWGIKERKHAIAQDLLPHNPLRSKPAIKSANNEIETFLFENGIDDFALPYLANFDLQRGLPTLIETCLKFLGLYFPRSLSFEESQQESHFFDQSTNSLGGMFDLNKEIDSRYDWNLVFEQIKKEERIISFNPHVFEPRNATKACFIRNLLYAIGSSLENLVSSCVNCASWATFIHSAIILFEAYSSKGNENHIQTVSKLILSEINVAKHDPKIWLTFAHAFRVQNNDKGGIDYKESKEFKIMLSTMDATGESGFHGNDTVWWLEMSVISSRYILGFYNLNHDREYSLTEHAKDKALHILCCAIEGKFFDMKKMKKDKNSRKNCYVQPTRMMKCKMKLKSLLLSCFGELNSKIYINFDPTPPLYHYVIIASLIEIIRSSNSEQNECINFEAGLNVLRFWIRKIGTTSTVATHTPKKSCLLRLSNAMLEFYLLSRSNDSMFMIDPQNILQNVLIPTVATLKNNRCTPSSSFLIAIALAESKLTLNGLSIQHGFDSLIYHFCHRRKLFSLREATYIINKAIYISNKEIRVDQGDKNAALNHCIQWSNEGIHRVQQAIYQVICIMRNNCMYSYSVLWRLIIRLEIIGGIQKIKKGRKQNDCDEAKIIKIVKRMLFKGRKYFEDGLTSCIFAKDLWLDAFQILRPAFDENELMVLKATLQELNLQHTREEEYIKIDSN